jgi:hypothetical protein
VAGQAKQFPANSRPVSELGMESPFSASAHFVAMDENRFEPGLLQIF